MKVSIFTLGVVLAIFTLASVASAKPTPPSSEKPVTYAATESEGPLLGSPAPTAPAPTAPTVPAARNGFDPVPSDQIPPLTKRLRLVEEIIRKHQRAYDYRVLTSHDLEVILSRLDAVKANPPTTAAAPIALPAATPVAAAAPAVAPAAPGTASLPEPMESDLGYPAPSTEN